MSFNIVRVDDVKPQPWKNGGGVTRELLAWPSAESWRVRISVADIEKDGPFSSFPGIKRTITVLSGAGIRLDSPINVRLRPKDPPFTFSGEHAPRCDLVSGPTRDLNAMFDQRDGAGRMQRWRTACNTRRKWVSFVSDTHPPLMFCIFTLDAATLLTRTEEIALPAMSLAWIEGCPPEMQLHSNPQAWAIYYTDHP